jgi:hypothetical protein
MALPPIVELDNGQLPTSPQFWLDAATASVRRYCEWHITPSITESMVLDGTGSRELLIPSGLVLDVMQCTNAGQDVTDQVEWSEKGVLTLRTGWTDRSRGIRLLVLHGYEEAPDVAGVIASVASRAAMNPSGALTSQRAGTQGFNMVAGSIPLMEAEKDQLAPYRLTWGP